jgi:hypothetical protein
LFWYYPGQTMYNSPLPLVDVPNVAPVNYSFHHHVGVNLLHGNTWLEEAAESHQWQERSHQIQMGLQQCLEIAVPWSNLHVQPDWPLEVLAVLTTDGHFVEYLPEDTLIPLQVP